MQKPSLKTLASSTLLGAFAVAALAVAAQAAPVAQPAGSEKCYGIAKAGKNDCAATGNNSCAGQATKDMDKAAYVYLPSGLCGKIAGGNTKAM